MILVHNTHSLGQFCNGIILDILSVYQNLTTGNGMGTTHGVQQGGFAATVGAQQADAIAYIYLQIHIFPDQILFGL